jgi:hypothetical protein
MSIAPVQQESEALYHDKTVRMWTGLLVAVWVLALMVAVFYIYSSEFAKYDYDSQQQRLADPVMPAHFWHAMVVALFSASLAMVFIVGGVALILNRGWSRHVLLAAAILQILVTIATQVWQAMLYAGKEGIPGRAFIASAIGIIIWNVIPVGILILAAARPKQVSTAGA